MYFKTEESGISGRACCLECMAYTTNRVRHKIKCVPTKELHAYETCRKQKILAVFLNSCYDVLAVQAVVSLMRRFFALSSEALKEWPVNLF